MLTLFTDRCFACEIISSAVDIIFTAISIVFYHKDWSNFRIPRNLFTCHWIRIASIVLCLDLQSLPTHVNELRGILKFSPKIHFICWKSYGLLLAVQANLFYLPVLSIRTDPKPYSFSVMILQTLKISSKKSWVLLKRTAKFPILILTPRWKNSGRNYGTFIIRGNLCLRQTHSQEHRMKIL